MAKRKLPPALQRNVERVKAGSNRKGTDMAGSGKMSGGAKGASQAIKKNKAKSKVQRTGSPRKASATTEGAQNARTGGGTSHPTTTTPKYRGAQPAS